MEALTAQIALKEDQARAATGKANKKLRSSLRQEIWELNEQLQALEVKARGESSRESTAAVPAVFQRKPVEDYEEEKSEVMDQLMRWLEEEHGGSCDSIFGT